jgi:hypothetical protein
LIAPHFDSALSFVPTDIIIIIIIIIKARAEQLVFSESSLLNSVELLSAFNKHNFL